MMNQSGELLTGKTRTRQSPYYSSVNTAAAAAFAATTRFFQDVVNVSGVGPETTNMQRAGLLPGGSTFLLSAMRIVLHGGAADMTTLSKQFTFRLKVSGILILEAPCDFWPGGGGVSTAASNGTNDARSITALDLDPVLITDNMNIVVEAVGTTFNAAAILFTRVYLDGRIEEPV